MDPNARLISELSRNCTVESSFSFQEHYNVEERRLFNLSRAVVS